MSTREKQWLQIFERQQWIINQAKQQAFRFDQDLASKLIIAGIAPPPWLLSSDPDASNHHELISGVPLPCTRPVITGSHCSVLDKPVATAHYRQLTYGLCTEHHGVGGKVLDLFITVLNHHELISGVPLSHDNNLDATCSKTELTISTLSAR